MTVAPGTIFTYNFIGVSLSWYGFIPKEYPITPSPATYSIDGQTPISFALKGLSSNATTIFNQKFFETSQLAAGSHSLEVVYQGNNSTPLTLDYLVVQNGTLPSTVTSVSSHATSTTDISGASTPGRSPTPVGAIVGGVIGGLTLIVFAALGFLILRRQQKHATQDKVTISTPKPFDYTSSHPSNTTPNSPLLGGTSCSQALPQRMQTGSAVAYGSKEYAYRASMPSYPNTSSAVTTHPTYVPFLYNKPL